MQSVKAMIKSRLSYHLAKLAPRNSNILIKLNNGLKYTIRSRTMDRAILKDIWIKEAYDQFGIHVSEGDTVVDIGAHIGVFSIYAASISRTGKVFAFEPFPENFQRLENHKRVNHLSNLICINKAVSDECGEQTLFVAADSNTGGHSLFFANEGGQLSISTTTLRSFCERENIRKIDFLKLDCEGAEFSILMSDPELLNRISKIVMECHPFNNFTVNRMIQFLEQNNFKVFRKSNNTPDGLEMLYAQKLNQ